MDLQLYLDRINFKDKVSVNKETLFGLQTAHLLHVPFENLDIHYKKKIGLEVESLFEKIVLNRRGGFCYELNGLFYYLLKEIGFKVQMISGRVYTKDGKYGEEYDHLAIIANVAGKCYLVDVGFGKFSWEPLPIALDVNLMDAFGIFRFDKAPTGGLRVNLVENENLVPQYLFDEKERAFQEFKEMCEFHQTSGASHFTNNKLISIITQNGRKTLTNNQIKITDGNIERIIEFEEELFEAHLKEYFTIELKTIAG